VLDIVNQVRMSGAATGVILMVNSDRADGADLDADPDICVLGKPFALHDLIATARRLAERAQTRAGATTGSGGHEASH